VPRGFDSTVDAAWDALDKTLNELNDNQDKLPPFEFQQENDFVFVSFKYEKNCTEIYGEYLKYCDVKDHDSLDPKEIPSKFKWTDEKEQEIVFRISRARDEPNAVIWENAVIEPAELSRAHLIVKSCIFLAVLTCFVLLFLLIKFQQDLVAKTTNSTLAS